MTPNEKEKVLGALGDRKWLFKCNRCGFAQEFTPFAMEDYYAWGMATFGCSCVPKGKPSDRTFKPHVLPDLEGVKWLNGVPVEVKEEVENP
jgi:hypothetical protein